ncbi:sphingomyelin phosphodiesterase [Chryseobacterium lactis]|uniref:Sphingomyelin phosphodiesterase n=1 Tax=Chryseobacterium lactis TaxID=1241981 RepID=A0A3G6RI91_CHRLC|nr:sphingomyelin phosphodiesterase [Chryseobacterium lactis]AZA84129.1 sphingomyelin phosphodiesterase [Chryseobacterium lactis]AZB04515.1 sphingomyelin phosphodiesterase [Chryseobacterium lactis]PNW12684.1 sphingomyelin phosphodiesterase [Chryseobacterium lactis]
MNYMYRFLSRFLPVFCLALVSCTSDQDLSSANEKESYPQQMAKIAPGAGIKVLTYNTFLLRDISVSSTTQWSQQARAEKLGEASFLKNYDVLLLQECFDNAAANKLRQKLLPTFPYQTPVLGQTKNGWNNTFGDWREISSGGLENGGVMIASKYPIERTDQYIFPAGCDFDALSLKGFAYVRIIKDGKRIHLISVHTQSTQPGCKGKEVEIRAQQLGIMKSYIDKLNIPADEMVVYGGDFNIIKDSPEYPKMLQTLNVNAPVYKGLSSTWDTKTNTMASYHYPYPANQREYLDYIFVSKAHLVPALWQNVAFDPVSSTLMNYTNLTGDPYYWADYSDHYPVEGNIYPDQNTPTKSLKFRKHDRISLKSVSTGKYINMNLSKTDDWLTVSSTQPDEKTWFNIINTGASDNYFDLKEGLVRVESSERINNFWYWESVSSGSYYFFPKQGKSLKTLTLQIVKKKAGNQSASVEDGDIVAFKDKTAVGNTYYLQVYNKSGTDWVYLNGTSVSSDVQFEVKMNNTSPQPF